MHSGLYNACTGHSSPSAAWIPHKPLRQNHALHTIAFAFSQKQTLTTQGIRPRRDGSDQSTLVGRWGQSCSPLHGQLLAVSPFPCHYTTPLQMLTMQAAWVLWWMIILNVGTPALSALCWADSKHSELLEGAVRRKSTAKMAKTKTIYHTQSEAI